MAGANILRSIISLSRSTVRVKRPRGSKFAFFGIAGLRGRCSLSVRSRWCVLVAQDVVWTPGRPCMSIESDADRLAMLKALGEQVEYEGKTVWAIFEKPYIDLGFDRAIESDAPQVTVRDSDVT